MMLRASRYIFFFFNDTATTEIYTLSLHDALPICRPARAGGPQRHGLLPRRRAVWLRRIGGGDRGVLGALRSRRRDRKSTRLNSSHANISYAVFCLKKKIKNNHLSDRKTHDTIAIQ